MRCSSGSRGIGITFTCLIEAVSRVRDTQTVPLMCCVGSISNNHCSLWQCEHAHPRPRSHVANAAMELESAACCVQNTTIDSDHEMTKAFHG